MRNGILFGVDRNFKNFAVVGDGCEGSVECCWMNFDELLFEFWNDGIEYIMLSGRMSLMPGFAGDEKDIPHIKDFLESLPVLSKISAECVTLSKDSDREVVSVTVQYCMERDSFRLEPLTKGTEEDNFTIEVVLNYDEDGDYWNPINDCKEAYEFLSKKLASVTDVAFCNFRELVESLNVEYWAELPVASPIMSVLKNRHIHACRNNPFNSLKFYQKYGVEESPVFRYPLMDHVIVFKTKEDKVFIVSNPYLTDAEITQYMDCLDRKSMVSGDYTELQYKILGKNKHIYSNASCNVVMFYL